MLIRFALRDGTIFAVALALWWLLAARSAGGDFVADFAGWVTGLLLAVCAYLAHEWSHYLGAVAMGSRVSVGTNLASGFLFRFEAAGNSLAQFVVMSLAGFVATALALAVFYTQLPDAWLASRVARGGAVFLAFLGLTLELPLLLYGLAIRGVPRQVAV
ncbi:MAG TPA: hypothetical protein PLW10_00090 [Myxococcota bacterium]|nr:hypothetical protein [Myxococcota bacterium]